MNGKTDGTPGRPTVMTPEVQDKVLSGIRTAGMGIGTAAAYAGVSIDAVDYLRKRDPEFEARLKLARETFKAETMGLISAAAPKDWRAGAWQLERLFPGEFARRYEVSGPEGGDIPVRSNVGELAKEIRESGDATRELSAVLRRRGISSADKPGGPGAEHDKPLATGSAPDDVQRSSRRHQHPKNSPAHRKSAGSSRKK